jgi:hypothetical protein
MKIDAHEVALVDNQTTLEKAVSDESHQLSNCCRFALNFLLLILLFNENLCALYLLLYTLGRNRTGAKSIGESWTTMPQPTSVYRLRFGIIGSLSNNLTS